jgi:hypothetical protein
MLSGVVRSATVPRLAGQRHQQGLAAGQAVGGVEDALADRAQHRERLLVADGVARGCRAIGVWRLRDRRRQLRFARREAEDVAAGEGEAPDREPGRVGAWQGRGGPDRGLPVGKLIGDGQDLARLPPLSPSRR